MSIYKWSSTASVPTDAPKELHIPATCTGLVRRSRICGAVIDDPSDVTAMTSQIPPFVFPSRRWSETLIIPPPVAGFFTVTVASVSPEPPPLTRVAEELLGQLSRWGSEAMWLAIIVALSVQGVCPWLTSA